MSPFYTVRCQEPGSSWIPTIYSFTCNSSIYVLYSVYKASVSLSLAEQIQALTRVAHVTAAA
jgi:hypothetical protein